MKLNSISLVLSLLAISSLHAQTASENFESYAVGNNLTTPLNGGADWNTSWATAGSTSSSGVVANTSPLTGGSTQYLDVDLSASGAGTAMGIGRQVSSEVQTGMLSNIYTVSFLWRADALGTFTAANDRFEFYSSNSAASLNSAGTGGNATTSPYLMGVFGAGRGSATASTFAVYSSPAVGGAFNASNYYNLGAASAGDATGNGTTLSLVAGTTYSFTITVDPSILKWDVSVSDGTNTATTTGLNWWGSTEQTFVGFGARGDTANETRSFSIDNVQLTAVPEPGTMGLFGLASLMLIAYRHRRLP